MAVNTYDEGDAIRGSVLFTNAAGSAVDPGTVIFRYLDPSGNTTSLTYGVDGALVKDGTGAYHVDMTIDEHGDWWYRWEGTGSNLAAEEAHFRVEKSKFV